MTTAAIQKRNAALVSGGTCESPSLITSHVLPQIKHRAMNSVAISVGLGGAPAGFCMGTKP